MVPELLVLALAFHRAPLQFPQLTDPTRPLPDAFGQWLAETSKALAPGRIRTTASALGTQPEKLQEAFLFFVRQTLLSPRADHYRVLGLPRHSSDVTIKRHHGLLVRMFHPDRMAGDCERSSALTARINAAYRTLRDPRARSRYDMSLRPFPEGSRSGADVSDFFRPREPTQSHADFGRRASLPRIRFRQLAPWALAAALILILLLLLKPEQPVLRVNPRLATGTGSGPSFLNTGKPKPAPTESAH